MAAKRRDGFASNGLSLSVLVLWPLSQSDSLRNIPANLYPLFLRRQYRVNPLIPTSNLLHISAVGVLEGFDDFNHPLVAIRFLLPLPAGLLRTSSGAPCLRVHFARFSSRFMVSFSRRGNSIMQLLQGGSSYQTKDLHTAPGPSTTEIM